MPVPHPGHRLAMFSGALRAMPGARTHAARVYSMTFTAPLDARVPPPSPCSVRQGTPSKPYDLLHPQPTGSGLPSLSPPARDLHSIAPGRLALGRGWHPPVSSSDGHLPFRHEQIQSHSTESTPTAWSCPHMPGSIAQRLHAPHLWYSLTHLSPMHPASSLIFPFHR